MLVLLHAVDDGLGAVDHAQVGVPQGEADLVALGQAHVQLFALVNPFYFVFGVAQLPLLTQALANGLIEQRHFLARMPQHQFFVVRQRALQVVVHHGLHGLPLGVVFIETTTGVQCCKDFSALIAHLLLAMAVLLRFHKLAQLVLLVEHAGDVPIFGILLAADFRELRIANCVFYQRERGASTHRLKLLAVSLKDDFSAGLVSESQQLTGHVRWKHAGFIDHQNVLRS